MKKWLQKRLKNEKGLTLVELLAVIVILGIIAAIAVPSIGGMIENTKYNAVKADAMNAINAANLYFIEEKDSTKTTVKISELVTGKYLESKGMLNDEDTVSNANPKIFKTSAAITYSGSKTVTIDASLKKINEDKVKGSADGAKEIK